MFDAIAITLSLVAVVGLDEMKRRGIITRQVSRLGLVIGGAVVIAACFRVFTSLYGSAF